MALLKLGFPYDAVMSMPEAEAEAYVVAYGEIVDPPKPGKKYKVRKKKAAAPGAARRS